MVCLQEPMETIAITHKTQLHMADYTTCTQQMTTEVSVLKAGMCQVMKNLRLRDILRHE